MRYLLLTDTHLGLYGDSDIWHTVVLNLFKDIYDTCQREDIDTIIHLGDFFHNRKSINTKTQAVAHEIAAMLENFQTFLIVGNHDSYYRNTITPNSLQFLNQYPNIKIVDSPTSIDDGVILNPWGWPVAHTDHKYCLGHFQIKGFHMNDNYTCKQGKDVVDFKSFKKVYSGHFHTPSKQDNVVYLGSPYQQTFNDKYSARGYYIWDSSDDNLMFIHNTKSPNFIEMPTNDLKLDEVNGNVVKLIFDKDYGTIENEKIIDQVTKKDPMKLHINFSEISLIDDDQQIEEKVKLLDHESIAHEYINKKCTPPQNINKKMLLNITMKLIGEIRNE